ncbi:MAG: Deoxyribose-phosphate aldolase [Thermoanaerobaculia bacterium]|nr:Deoxyribose-phosphate aldolase [Thermoanaerobaculia bacterium]
MTAKRRVVVGSDHGGYALKEAIEKHLSASGFDVLDVGTHSTEACDYPVFARAAAEAVASGQAFRGVVVDGAGIGSGMVANKVPGVRAGMAFDLSTAKNAREHNDANVLTLGASYLSEDLALKIVDVFLTTECTVERHKRRVAQIDALDAPRLSTTRSAMSASPSPSPDFELLVGRISAILAANPSLLGASTCAGAASGSCAGCPIGGHCATKCTPAVRSMIECVGPGCRISSAPGVGEVPKDLAQYIDHTLLKADATYAEIDKLCSEAAQFGFASVCVNPIHVKRAAQRLAGARPLVCTVVGFPLGATPKEIKALEARRAIRDGAREVDMVLAIGALKSGDVRYVEDDIRLVAEAAHDGGAILKVILETSLLTDQEKVAACVAARNARADFVKTSTGFSTGGATAHDVALMAEAVDHKLGVKASGGIRSASDAQKMIAAGATRIGASVGVKIVKESKGQSTSSADGKGAY